MMTREQAESRCFIRVPVGSVVHGLNLPGKDDRDEMGVLIEDLSTFTCFSEFEQFIYRTATEREGRHDAPSMPGDLDLTIYGLRKYLRLALQGNPSVINLLFVPQTQWVSGSAIGQHLQDLAPFIVSRECGKRFLGYLEAQRQRLLGERGQKKVNRPELEAAYGFDTKYAMHILRLGYQGVELLETGRISMPMQEPIRSRIFSVREGKIPLNDVLTEAGEIERRLKGLLTTSVLPDQPNRDCVREWMTETYYTAWKCERFKDDFSPLKGGEGEPKGKQNLNRKKLDETAMQLGGC